MPLNKAVLAAFKAATRLAPSPKSSYKATRLAEDLVARLDIPSPRCRVEDALAAPAAGGYRVPVRIFTPLDLDFSLRSGITATPDYRGTVLFFHGGGWVNGDVDFYTDACTTMALKLERRVVSVDYRRAPEHRFPRAAEDCYEVARQLFAGTLAPELLPAVDPRHVVLFGDSAGGNLAAVVSLMARDRGAFAPPAQILLYPATAADHDPATSPFESLRTNGEDYLLSTQDVRDYLDLYAPNPADRANPYLAPLLAPSLANQPRTLVVTAEYCPLRDEGEAYARALALAGNQVSCYRMLDAIHGYLLYPSVLSLVKDTYELMRGFLDGTAPSVSARAADTPGAKEEVSALPWLEIATPGTA